MVDFRKGKKQIEEKKRLNQEIINAYHDMEEIDFEKAFIGAMIANTGKAEFHGIDYKLQEKGAVQEYEKNMQALRKALPENE